jgi:transcriptional regulator with XRE-family HTH domain
MSQHYPNMGDLQPKTMFNHTNQVFGISSLMRGIDPIAFGQRVRERRNQLGWNQIRLGKETGYSQQRIGSIEAGETKHPERLVAPLAMAMGVSAEWLLWREGSRPQKPLFLSPKELAGLYEHLTDAEKESVSKLVENKAARKRPKAG